MRLIELSPPGRKVVTGTLLFTTEDIIRFAKKFDPQPFHVDAEAAKDYVFGALCASGWHTCAGWMKTYIAYWTKEVARLESEGLIAPKLGPSAGFKKLQWLKPVYAGDTITYSVQLTESRPLTSRSGTFINMTINDGVNQHGDVVMRYEGTVLEFA
ncbi:acyl dehydratase [Neorhizobium sp. R1-B]|uniref:MaoC family dehydratase n=1 Tax=unclassified Neorhizobium TaxID=2629175 RepID=UPI00104962FF|nr:MULTISPECIES: MaoC family dehydratase [unclassified Neorhizobium]TCV74375.1 acyl dehydratase [Neorhizobium sp. S3-V5DH]TDX87561.1 acyl dehydratase [Neorhizobium sp. R1-B]